MHLPIEILNKLWPHASDALKIGISNTSESVFNKYGINTLPDTVDFMAQISEETNGGIALTENLNYSANRLCQVWPSRFPTLEIAMPFSNNPRALANNVYGNRYGNIAGSNDGWNFRGRGLIQLTFRSLYDQIGKTTGLDLINNPDIVSSSEHALECAAAYWFIRGVSKVANSGDFNKETLIINGGYTNMAARLYWKSLWYNSLSDTKIDKTDYNGQIVGSISWAQDKLIEAGFDTQGVDGIWGPDSMHALHAFEVAKGLKIDAGILGPETIEALKLV